MTRLKNFFGRFAFVYIGTLALVMFFLKSYNIEHYNIPFLLIPLCLLVSAAYVPKRLWLPAVMGILLAAVLVVYLKIDTVANGFIIVGDVVCDHVNWLFDTEYYIIGEVNHLLSEAESVSYLVLSLAAVVAVLLGMRRTTGVKLVVILAAFVAIVYSAVNPNYIWAFALLLYFALILLTGRLAASEELMYKTMLRLAPITLAVILAIGLISPKSGYKWQSWPDTLYNAVQVQLYNIFGINLPIGGSSVSLGGDSGSDIWIYDTEEINLSRLGPQSYSGKTVLQIQTDAVGVRYLRGYSMSTYTGSGWIDPDEQETAYELLPISGGVISPLHFASTAHSGGDYYDISITNVTDRSGIIYTPYYLQLSAPMPDESDAMGGYILPVRENGVYSDSMVTRQGYSIGGTDVLSFVTGDVMLSEIESPLELTYRDYVYEYYTNVPDYLAEELVKIANENGIYADMERSELCEAVKQYISTAARYTLTAEVTPAGEDFILYFLTESKEGYCMHYASSATAMLQALGVPARYVAGFAAVVSESKAGEVVDVLDSNAHAWVEVYFDGIGWLPYEVTGGSGAPRYSPAGEQENLPSPSPSFEMEEPSPSPSASTTKPENEETQTDAEDAESFFRPWMLIPIGILAAVLAIILRRRIVIRRRNKKMYASDRNAAVIYTWRFIERTYKHSEPPEWVYDIAAKAKFSQHRITEEEHQMVLVHFEEITAVMYRGESLLKRIWLKYFRLI